MLPFRIFIDWTKQLLDGSMTLWKRARESQDILSSALESRVQLKLRFRHDSTTVILHPLEEIGVLDKQMAAALKSLKEIATSITIELYLDNKQDIHSGILKEDLLLRQRHGCISAASSGIYFACVGSHEAGLWCRSSSKVPTSRRKIYGASARLLSNMNI